MGISPPSETLLASPPFTGCSRHRNKTSFVEGPPVCSLSNTRLAFEKTKGSKNGG